MSVMLPVRATFTHEVTAANDLAESNLHAFWDLAPVFSFAKILAISDRAVDFPYPHSPKTQAVNWSAMSLLCFYCVHALVYSAFAVLKILL